MEALENTIKQLHSRVTDLDHQLDALRRENERLTNENSSFRKRLSLSPSPHSEVFLNQTENDANNFSDTTFSNNAHSDFSMYATSGDQSSFVQYSSHGPTTYSLRHPSGTSPISNMDPGESVMQQSHSSVFHPADACHVGDTNRTSSHHSFYHNDDHSFHSVNHALVHPNSVELPGRNPSCSPDPLHSLRGVDTAPSPLPLSSCRTRESELPALFDTHDSLGLVVSPDMVRTEPNRLEQTQSDKNSPISQSALATSTNNGSLGFFHGTPGLAL
jgi:hypothetical protein